MISPQKFCVKWNSYSTNFQSCFPRLRAAEHFVDITLACEGQMIKCHKVVLSACSLYFERLLIANPCQHPIVFMKDMKYWEVQSLVDFMYKGEVHVSQDELNSLLIAAEALQIRGLCGSENPNCGMDDPVPYEPVVEPRLPKGTVVSAPAKRRREEKMKAAVGKAMSNGVKKTREKAVKEEVVEDEDSIDLAELQQQMDKDESMDTAYQDRDHQEDEYDAQDDSDAGSVEQSRAGPSGISQNRAKEKTGAAKPKEAAKRKRGRPRNAARAADEDTASSCSTAISMESEDGEAKEKRRRGRPRSRPAAAELIDIEELPEAEKEAAAAMEIPRLQNYSRGGSNRWIPGWKVQNMIERSDALSPSEVTFIRSFVNGSRINPWESVSNIVTFKLSEVAANSIQTGDVKTPMKLETLFEINYETEESYKVRRVRRLDDVDETLDDIAVVKYDGRMNKRKVDAMCEESKLGAAERAVIVNFVEGTRVNPWEGSCDVVSFPLGSVEVSGIRAGDEKKAHMRAERVFELDYNHGFTREIVRVRRDELAEKERERSGEEDKRVEEEREQSSEEVDERLRSGEEDKSVEEERVGSSKEDESKEGKKKGRKEEESSKGVEEDERKERKRKEEKSCKNGEVDERKERKKKEKKDEESSKSVEEDKGKERKRKEEKDERVEEVK